MKKVAIVLVTTLAFVCIAFFAIYPVQQSQGFNYSVKEYTVKPAYENVDCPATGNPVPAVVHMDPSESGPCDCPTYYNYDGIVSYPFMGFKCLIPPNE